MLSMVESLALLLCGAAAAAANKPNVLVVLADDLGYGDVGYTWTDAGHAPSCGLMPKTPNLDAMSKAPHVAVLERMYTGSPVCSPTRASFLTGRTPDRECIYTAEGCGQQPAWECDDQLPLPPQVFTAAEAAKQAGYSTLHLGKWHLGDFWDKRGSEDWPLHRGLPGQAKHPAWDKWPVSNPAQHGFDEWLSTEASAASTTPNCACKSEWLESGCIIGGGNWTKEHYNCTNYWYSTSTEGPCLDQTRAGRDCVGNLTEKVEGDDSEFIIDKFEKYLDRRSNAASDPFFVFMHLHTVHTPHPALPKFYAEFPEGYGDYMGTITQMDTQIGRLRQLLASKGLAEDTLLWFTSDNGGTSGAPKTKATIPDTNGRLRQCKGSVFEGGVHVAGLLEWPGKFGANTRVPTPVSTLDLLPTLLELWKVPSSTPHWPLDGTSLLPILDAAVAGKVAQRSPIGLKFYGQQAWIDGDMKLVRYPGSGLCKWEEPYINPRHRPDTFLFNITADPEENHELSAHQPHVAANMAAELDAWVADVKRSQEQETGCSVKQEQVVV